MKKSERLNSEQIDNIWDNQLTEEEMVILKLRVFYGPLEIARVLQMSEATIHRIVKKANKKIKDQSNGLY